MNTFKIGTVFTFFICSLSIIAQSTVTGELRKWHTVTVLFDGPSTSEEADSNPFLDYRLNVTFTSSTSGEKFIVPGFYAADGNAAETSATSGNKWAVRFTPNRTGIWGYEASFRAGDEVAISDNATAGNATSFDGVSGTFSVGVSDKSLPDNRAKGRLSYVGERYLKYEETNGYFLKAGSDSPENLLAYSDFDNTVASKDWSPHEGDWETGDPVWKGDQGKGLIGAINYLSDKGMNAFSFLTMNVIGDGKDVWPWTSSSNELLDGFSGVDVENRLRYDISKLEQWEILFSHADSKGMYLHFKTQETENDNLLDGGQLLTERKLYYRELVARFGHHLALNWNLGEEYDLYDEGDNSDNGYIKSYIEYILSLDPYDHNIVVHSYPSASNQERLYGTLLGDDSGLTGASLQLQLVDIHDDVKGWVVASEESGKPWVVANDEQGYSYRGVAADEDYSGNTGNQSDNREDIRHQVLWGTLMAGGAGVEYYFGYQTGETDLTAEDFRSRNSKWDDAKIALDFFQENIPFWEMDSNDDLTSVTDDYCFAKEDEIYLVYLPNGGNTSLNLSNVSGSYSVKWFNPSTGGSLLNGTITLIQSGSSRSIGNPPNNTTADWVALITKIDGDDPVDPPNGDCEYDYEEIDGLVLMEAENLEVISGWQEMTTSTGFTGAGYLNWQGGNSFNTPGSGVISTSIKINTPGTYFFQWRNRIGAGSSTTDNNDSWLRFPDADDFYGERGSSIVYPHGSGKTPNPNGAGSDGWFKVYANNLNWNWTSNTSDNDPHSIYVTFNSAGTYTMEISGRSNNHLIDRIVLSQNYNGQTNTNLTETLCDGNNSSISVTGISVTPESAIIEVGNTVDIDADVIPNNATDNGVDWSSSDTSVATVNTIGVVTAHSEGNVTITASSQDGGFTDSSAITVEPEDTSRIPVTGITVAPQILILEESESSILTYSITPSNATNNNVIWSSEDEDVAVVNQNGLVTALNEGVVEIIATTEDGSYVSNTTVTVNAMINGEIPVEGINVSPQQILVGSGETFVANASILPSNATNKNVIWSTNDSSIATINQSGLVRGISLGTTTISATSEEGGFIGSSTVIVDNHGDDVAVVGILITPENITLESGYTHVFGFVIDPINASNKNVTWSSSNPTIASVDQNGLVTARGEGIVSITITTEDGDFSDVSSVTVTEPINGSLLATRIFVQPQRVSLAEGESIVLSYEITPVNATNNNVVWSSGNESVATVNQNGVVVAHAEGVVEIAVTLTDGSRTSDSTVTVTTPDVDDIPATSIAITPEELIIEIDDTFFLDATVSPSNATNSNVVWSSTDATVASVSQEGFITALSEGTTIITVRTVDGSNLSAVSDITVLEIFDVTGVSLSPENLSMDIGDLSQFVVTIAPENATNKNVMWSSSDESIAIVDENGLVTALSEGDVTITVTSQDGNYSAISNVQVLADEPSEIVVTSVEVTPEELSLEIETSEQLSVTVLPVEATNVNVTWTSSDETIATVSSEGLVQGIAVGDATISVTTEDGGYVASVMVEVIEMEAGDDLEQVSLFPNPTSDTDLNPITIVNLDTEEGGIIGLYTVGGSLLKRKLFTTDETISISLSGLSRGVYIVRIDNNREVIIRKVIKI